MTIDRSRFGRLVSPRITCEFFKTISLKNEFHLLLTRDVIFQYRYTGLDFGGIAIMRFVFNSRFWSRASVLLLLVLVLAWTRTAFGDSIHHAAEKGDLAKVKELLKDAPNLVSAKDKFGKTPLHLAAKNGHKDVAELLLANGADINARDSNGGFTPLDLALSSYHYKDIVEFLLARGADANARSDQGLTPLQEAAMRGQKDTVNLLLGKNADVNARDEKGNTPLLWALLLGHTDVAELLVTANADVNAKNNQGLTAMSLARRRNDTKLEGILRQHGGHE
jgi:ankyrin repeat protein